MVSEHRGIAFERLSYEGEPHTVDEGIVAFMETLCDLEKELLEFETKVSELEIDYTGWQATHELASLEAEHSEFVNDLQTAHRMVILKHLTRFDRYDSEKHTRRTQQKVPDHRQEFLAMIHHLQDIADRIGRRIDAKRNSANSRLVLSASLFAVLISTASFLTQLVI